MQVQHTSSWLELPERCSFSQLFAAGRFVEAVLHGADNLVLFLGMNDPLLQQPLADPLVVAASVGVQRIRQALAFNPRQGC